MLKKLVFTIGQLPKAYIGYTGGKLWNGWVNPYFEYKEAIKVAKEFNKDAKNLMYYDEIYDQFYVYDGKEFEIWKGTNFQTAEGIKHLYGIGAYRWNWEAIEPTTEGIVNLLARYGFNVGKEFITKELKNIYILRKTIEALRANKRRN